MAKIYQKSFPGGKNAGFTLIELLVVVLIIGILAAIAIPQYEKAVIRSQFKQAEILARSVHQALHVAYLEQGKYPVKFEDLDITLPTPIKKTENDTQQQYVYSWGYCQLRPSSPGNIQCHIIRPDGRFGIEWFADETKYCFSPISFQIGNSICSTETGNSNPIPGATNSLYYKYQ